MHFSRDFFGSLADPGDVLTRVGCLARRFSSRLLLFVIDLPLFVLTGRSGQIEGMTQEDSAALL
jgi:hypothetical protein